MNSDAVKETDLDVELRDIQHENEVRSEVPIDGNAVGPRERIVDGSQTQRGLKSRHIQMIALGGSMGTGLFVGTGTTLSLAGPAPLFMCTSPHFGYESR